MILCHSYLHLVISYATDWLHLQPHMPRLHHAWVTAEAITDTAKVQLGEGHSRLSLGYLTCEFPR